MQRQNKVWLDIVKYFKPYRNDDDVGPGCGAQIKPSVVGKFGNQDQACAVVVRLIKILNAGIVICYSEVKGRLLFRHKKCL